MYKYTIEYQRCDQESVLTRTFLSEEDGGIDPDGYAYVIPDCFAVRLPHLISVAVEEVTVTPPP